MSNPTLLDATEQELLRAIVAARTVERINELDAQLAAYRARKDDFPSEFKADVKRLVGDGPVDPAYMDYPHKGAAL